ncbi:hypothetical protein C8R48DRAFT_778103 [Suillus tomentosus]|nr:hypothetical protein C8R48DRAFT_778103 [Suillus tomentosus]
MTDNYPQWHKYHTKKRSSDYVKAERDLEDESITDLAPIATQKWRLEEVDLIKNPFSNLASKPRPRPIPLKIPVTLTVTSTSTSKLNLTPIPSTNDITQHTLLSMPEVPSTADLTSLDVKMEVIAASQSAEQTKITINSSKPDTIKKCQPSTKLMRVSAKITAQ